MTDFLLLMLLSVAWVLFCVFMGLSIDNVAITMASVFAGTVGFIGILVCFTSCFDVACKRSEL